MTDKELLLTILVNEERYGKEKAIKARELISKLKLQDNGKWGNRKINILAEQLRNDGYPVISSKDQDGGYFLAETIDEIREFDNVTLSEISKLQDKRLVINSLAINLMDKNIAEGHCNLYQQKSPSVN